MGKEDFRICRCVLLDRKILRPDLACCPSFDELINDLLGSPAPASNRLKLRLFFVALITQALFVGLIIRPAFSKRDDVIALRGRSHAALPLAFGAQRIAREQRRTHGLQSPPGDTLRWRHLRPLLPWMFGTPAAAIAHKDRACRE